MNQVCVFSVQFLVTYFYIFFLNVSCLSVEFTTMLQIELGNAIPQLWEMQLNKKKIYI